MKTEEERIDELIAHIDSFMTKGGGHMNVKAGDGESSETLCTACCGETSDNACNTPVK